MVLHNASAVASDKMPIFWQRLSSSWLKGKGFFLHCVNKQGLIQSSKYYTQVQGQLLICEQDYRDFVGGLPEGYSYRGSTWILLLQSGLLRSLLVSTYNISYLSSLHTIYNAHHWLRQACTAFVKKNMIKWSSVRILHANIHGFIFHALALNAPQKGHGIVQNVTLKYQ